MTAYAYVCTGKPKDGPFMVGKEYKASRVAYPSDVYFEVRDDSWCFFEISDADFHSNFKRK